MDLKVWMNAVLEILTDWLNYKFWLILCLLILLPDLSILLLRGLLVLDILLPDVLWVVLCKDVEWLPDLLFLIHYFIYLYYFTYRVSSMFLSLHPLHFLLYPLAHTTYYLLLFIV